MIKVALFTLAIAFSMSTFAQSTDLGNAISKTLNQQQSAPVKQQVIYYGGKDISHSIVR